MSRTTDALVRAMTPRSAPSPTGSAGSKGARWYEESQEALAELIATRDERERQRKAEEEASKPPPSLEGLIMGELSKHVSADGPLPLNGARLTEHVVGLLMSEGQE